MRDDVSSVPTRCYGIKIGVLCRTLVTESPDFVVGSCLSGRLGWTGKE